MKVYRLPENLTGAAILFDMDSTLYTHEEYAKTQIDLPVKRLAQEKGKSFEQMKIEVEGYRKKWAESHGGHTISLGNSLLAFGVTIENTILWREELYRPEDYLSEDKQLKSAMEHLASYFTLAVVTNNPVSVVKRTLSVLGINEIINKIVGLDTCRVSKPNKIILEKASEICGVDPSKCISVGDRYDIDLALPLEMGMGAILVDGVADVYKLPELFCCK
jgi:phosphoglycolate phosphatase/putative hydrolase of the HAD superfamily